MLILPGVDVICINNPPVLGVYISVDMILQI